MLFGIVEYLEIDIISVPLTLGNNIESLDVSDFEILNVDVLRSYMEGEDNNYKLFITPEIEQIGILSINAIGRVYRDDSSGYLDMQTLSSDTLSVPFNTVEPKIISRLSPPVMLPGTHSVYLDLNRDVVGLTPQGILITGADVGSPKIFAAPTPISPNPIFPVGTRPFPDEYKEYFNTDIPRRYYRIDFHFPNPPPLGNLNIDLVEGSVLGYIDRSLIITTTKQAGGSTRQRRNKRTRQTRQTGARQSTPIAPLSLNMQDVILIKGRDFEVSGVISGNPKPTHVYVESLLRGWRYIWNSSSPADLRVAGDAADTERIENGIWKARLFHIVNAVPNVNWNAARKFTYCYRNLSFDCGSPSGSSRISRFMLSEDFFSRRNTIYRMHATNNYLSVRIRIEGGVASGGDLDSLRCRYSNTRPTNSNITTLGTELFNIKPAASPISVDETITNPGDGLYFWFYLAEGTDAIFDGILRVSAVGESQSSIEEIVNVNWRVQEVAPVIVNPGTIKFYKDVPANLLVEVQNFPGGVSIHGLIIGFKHFLESNVSDTGNTSSGARIFGIPNREISLSENRRMTINASTSGGTDMTDFLFEVRNATPPPITGITRFGISNTFYWSSVSGALDYEYALTENNNPSDTEIKELDWQKTGNSTRINLSDVSARYLIVRVSSPWTLYQNQGGFFTL